MEHADSNATDSVEATAALVRAVYWATWSGFYLWEQDHCRQTLHSLARVLPPVQVGPHARIGGLSVSETPAPTVDVDGDTEGDQFTVWDYGCRLAESILSVESINIAPQLKPCPPYEMCTPAARNIYVGDDFEEMPFIPLSDDPTFDHVLHTEDYKYFEWQLPNGDPDCKSDQA